MNFKRKELAKNAKKNLKKHYWLLVAVCLFAAFIGSEFTETTKILGRTRGVFASLVNAITSGGIVFTFVDSLSSVISSRRAVVLILLIAALMVYVFITFFIKKTYLVILRRIVLETRTYDAVPPGKFMFLLRVKRWMKASWVLIVNNV